MSMLFKRIKDWAVSITSFRTGDVIPVDGPSGTAKMPYSDLAKEVIKDSANNTAATEADLVAGSKVPIMTANGPKSLPGNTIAKASEQAALTTYAQNVANSLAPEFDPTRDYVVDESCTYEGTAYIFTSDHPAGAWNPAHATISGQSALLRLTAAPADVNSKVLSYIMGESYKVNSVSYSDGVASSLNITFTDGKNGSIAITRDSDGNASSVLVAYDDNNYQITITRNSDGNVTRTSISEVA